MLTMNLNRLRAALLATTVALGAAPLAMAQDSAPALTPAADYAGAVIRQDMFKGVYELVDDAEAGVLYVASTPNPKENTAGYVHVLNRDDLSNSRFRSRAAPLPCRWIAMRTRCMSAIPPVARSA